jgi:ubiquinone/menaquinone biosynthesis C-methylase UbiE
MRPVFFQQNIEDYQYKEVKIMRVFSKTQANRIREKVRHRYGRLARRDASGCGCCAQGDADNSISANLYSEQEASSVPVQALHASLGCGNPTALAKLNPGEVVLDLGSGGGIDVLLSAKRVGPEGYVYGLDMTDEMLALAEENRRKAGVDNVRFLKGYIEDIPLPDNSVDVVISNCVINLSTDKPRVLREAFRVLKPGGRLAISDMVMLGQAPPALLRSMEAWAGCIAGALRDTEYLELLKQAGFEDPEVQIIRRYSLADITCEGGYLPPGDMEEADGVFASAFVRATKRTSAERAIL